MDNTKVLNSGYLELDMSFVCLYSLWALSAMYTCVQYPQCTHVYIIHNVDNVDNVDTYPLYIVGFCIAAIQNYLEKYPIPVRLRQACICDPSP